MVLEAQDQASAAVEDVNKALDELATASEVDEQVIAEACRRIDDDFAQMTAASEKLNHTADELGDAADTMAGRWVDANGRMHDATGRFVSGSEADFLEWERELNKAGADADGWAARVSAAFERVRAGSKRLVQAAGNGASALSSAAQAALSFEQKFETVAGTVGNLTSKIHLMALGIASLAGPASAGALLAVVGIFAGIGIAAVKSNAQVTAAFTKLKGTVKSTLASAFAPIVPYLTSTMNLIGQTFKSLAPSFRVAAQALGPMIQALGQGFSQFAKIIIPALAGAMKSLQPVVSALAQGLTPLAQGLAGFFKSLNAGAAAKGLSTLLAAVGQLLPLVGQLLNALIPVGNAILTTVLPPAVQLAQVLVTALIPVFQAIMPVVKPLISVIVEVAQTFVQLVVAAAPLIPPILKIIVAFANLATPLEKIAPLFGTLATAIAPLLPIVVQIANLLVGFLNTAFTELAAAIQPLIPPLGQLAKAILSALLQVLTALMPGLTAIIGAFVDLMPAITPLIQPLIQIVNAVTPLLVQLAKLAAAIIGPVAKAFAFVVTLIAKFVQGFMGPGVKAVKDFVTMVKGYISGFMEVFHGVLEFFEGVFTGNWSKAWKGIQDIVKGVIKMIGSIIGGIVNIGKDLIMGLVKGIEGAVGYLLGKVKDLCGKVTGAFKSVLGIFSPSQVMADEVGAYIPAGIAKGITDNLHLVTNAAQKVAAGATTSARIGISGGLGGNGLSALGGGGGGTVINMNVTGNQVMNDRDMDKLARKLGTAVATRILPQAGVRIQM